MRVLLAVSRQAWKLRLLLWASFAACAGALWWGWALSQTYGLNPGDGGVLRPAGERLAMGGLVALLGLAFAAGMVLMTNIYVTRLTRDGARLVVETLTPLGVGARRIEFSVSAVRGGAYYHGRRRFPSAPSVNAPWITLRITGHRLPFVLDLQAERIDRAGLSNLVPRAVAGWKIDRG